MSHDGKIFDLAEFFVKWRKIFILLEEAQFLNMVTLGPSNDGSSGGGKRFERRKESQRWRRQKG